MNKIEAGLGVAIVLAAVLFVLFLNQGVVRSGSGAYTYQFPQEFSGWCLILLLFAGPSAILHASLTKRFVELGLGISVTIWTYSVWFFVISLLYIDYAEVGYIKQFPTSHILTWLSIAPNALWGAFMVADGFFAEHREKSKLKEE